MIGFAIDSVGVVCDVCVGDGLVGEGGRAMRGRVSAKWTALDHAAKMRKRDPSAVDTHQIISLWKHRVLVVADLTSYSGRRWRAHDLPLDGRIAVVARVRTSGPFAFLLGQSYEPPSVTGQGATAACRQAPCYRLNRLQRAGRGGL